MMAEAFMRQSLTYWSPSRPAAHKKRLAVKIANPHRLAGQPVILIRQFFWLGFMAMAAPSHTRTYSDIIAAWLLLTAAGPRRFCTGLLY